MLESTKKNLASQGMPFKQYLEKRGMSEEQVLEEMRPSAVKRASLDLIFAKIAKDNELKPDDQETHRVAHALMHQGVPDHAAHQYGAEVSIREQVWVALGVAEPKPIPPPHSDPNHSH
jgi:FKBP-type peptidyl-prolyl cis-trans isomerase (trigger factor)